MKRVFLFVLIVGLACWSSSKAFAVDTNSAWSQADLLLQTQIDAIWNAINCKS